MKVQTRLYIERGVIKGLLLNNHTKKWKRCKWCNHTFIPVANKQQYCDDTCRHIARQQYKSNWMYHQRVLERSGEIVNDRSILNLGTGNLGEHSSKIFSVEHEKIQRELRELGLK